MTQQTGRTPDNANIWVEVRICGTNFCGGVLEYLYGRWMRCRQCGRKEELVVDSPHYNYHSVTFDVNSRRMM